MSEINLEPSELEIEHALEMLLPKIQVMITTYCKINFKYLDPSSIEVSKGSKYWKLILARSNNSRSVYGFIRRSDGAILKAASWSRPQLKTEKHICGFITDDESINCFGPYGVRHVAY